MVFHLQLNLCLDALKLAITLCVSEADIYVICQAVDKKIEEDLSKVYQGKKTKKIERGVAFPCSISLNHVVGHYSPVIDESSKIQSGDVVKIICGAHIDGYAGCAAYTFVAGSDKVTGRKADVVLAAHHAMMAAERVIRD